MTTRRGAAAVAAALAMLTACSSSGGADTSTAGGLPSHPTSGPKADRLFLKVERSEFPAAIDDRTLIDLAHGMCRDFDKGADWVTELSLMIHQGGAPAKAAGGFIAAAVATYCPKNMSVLPSH